jgi:hypothetical protein
MQVATQFAHRDEVLEASLPPGQSDRTTAQFLVAHASEGDAVVFTSLTRAPADYYFGRSGAERRFREFSFPADVATHLGWTERTVTQARHEALDAEAITLATQLRELAQAHKTVWVYDGPGEVRAILLQRLQTTLSIRRTHTLEGPYHTSILECGAVE